MPELVFFQCKKYIDLKSKCFLQISDGADNLRARSLIVNKKCAKLQIYVGVVVDQLSIQLNSTQLSKE